jgi:hypothetical protein
MHGDLPLDGSVASIVKSKVVQIGARAHILFRPAQFEVG